MAYGDYEGPDKSDKGLEGGSCNRTLCQAPNAIWYNHGSMSWYCEDCKKDIGEDRFNKMNWMLNHYPKCGHLMFETREQMDERKEQERLGSLEVADDDMHDLMRLQIREMFPEVDKFLPRKEQPYVRSAHRVDATNDTIAGESRQQRRARERRERK